MALVVDGEGSGSVLRDEMAGSRYSGSLEDACCLHAGFVELSYSPSKKLVEACAGHFVGSLDQQEARDAHRLDGVVLLVMCKAKH